MTREQYLARRSELLNSAREINNAESFDRDAFDEVKNQVEALDAEWEARAQAQADIETLNGRQPSVNDVVDLTRNAGEEMPGQEPAGIYDSVEYRNAFMNYVTRGTAIPDKFRNENATTVTGTTGAVIPTTQMREIIREMKSRGNIWNKVRKLNVQGGVEFPIVDLIPTATWIGEEKSSDDKNLKAEKTVTFSYHGLECKLSQSLLSSIVSLKEFEDLFPTLAAEAIIAALEVGVFNGSGSGQMTGILNETRIPAANTIEMSTTDVKSWATWKSKIFTKMKKAYRNGDFFMAQGTFDAYIDGMVDANGQPIGRVSYGIDGGETYRFGGKTVETVEDDVIKAFDDASTGDVIAVFGNLANYAVNSNLQMNIVKWTDHDNNKEKTKAIMILDGHVLDPNGFLIIKKGA